MRYHYGTPADNGQFIKRLILYVKHCTQIVIKLLANKLNLDHDKKETDTVVLLQSPLSIFWACN